MCTICDLENIKNKVQNVFKLSQCYLSNKDSIQLVLQDNYTEENIKEILDFCKIELEKISDMKYKVSRCKVAKDLKKVNCCTRIYFFREDSNNAK